jgi:DNA-binding response OmpR family regulator
LLTLFAHNPNELLLRDRLLKEVWEDEGVITGRSLDMFVSKLRKKLHHDSAVNLVNVHGKGYRLEV